MRLRGASLKVLLGLSVFFSLGGVTGIYFFGPARVDGAPPQGGKIIFAARQDIYTLDPQMAKWASERKIMQQFTDTLVAHNPKDGKFYPGLAESWEISRDGKAYTFKLRKNVKFHDGTPFDAAAVKFTFDRIQEPAIAGTLARTYMTSYESSEVIDSYTVRVRFKQPYAPFLALVSDVVLAPISPTAATKMGSEFATRSVATGPFMVKEWVPKDHVTLVRNPNYNWASPVAKHQGPAYLDEIIWRTVPETTTRTAVLTTGEVTITEDLAYSDIAGLEKNPNVRILRGVPAGTPWLIFPNVDRFPTNERRVRQALHHAIDKQAIVRTVFHGQTQPGSSPLQPTMPGYVPVAKEFFPYDPTRAKNLLGEAGWKPGPDGIRTKDGKRLELVWIFGTGDGWEEMALLIQGMAREVGIDIQLREMPRAQMHEAYRRGEHNIAETSWWYPDPVILSTLFHSAGLATGFNRARLGDSELDKMLDDAAAMTDARARSELYKKIQRTLMEMAAVIPVADQVTIVGARKEVEDYRFNIVTFPVLYDVYLKK